MFRNQQMRKHGAYAINLKKGNMSSCHNENCPIEWFHFQCVGFKKKPSAKTKWYCPDCKKSKRKSQGVPQSQTAALPRPQEETDKSKQAQTEQTYEKH